MTPVTLKGLFEARVARGGAEGEGQKLSANLSEAKLVSGLYRLINLSFWLVKGHIKAGTVCRRQAT